MKRKREEKKKKTEQLSNLLACGAADVKNQGGKRRKKGTADPRDVRSVWPMAGRGVQGWDVEQRGGGGREGGRGGHHC